MVEKLVYSHSKVNNGPTATGNHCEGTGQFAKRIILKYDPSINQPEVYRMEDKATGQYGYTVVVSDGLNLTQAEYDVYAAMS